MIRQIKLIRNIGTFDSDAAAASLELKRLVLVYAENGRGKTTLAAILRSLATGNPLPILERRRLGAQNPPHIVLDCESNPSNVMFQNGAWNRTLLNVKIYDDVFVEQNVHSGLNVEAIHRQNLHELTLGDLGVALHQRRQELVSRIAEHNTALTEKERAIPSKAYTGVSIDEFWELPDLSDIEAKIETANRELMAARDHDAIQTTLELETIELPEFDIEAVERILLTELSDLDNAAEARVQEHLKALGDKGEAWVADGMARMSTANDEVCPFCGQSITSLELITHYRAYFSEGYTLLKQEVAAMIANVNRDHADGVPVSFVRTVGRTQQRIQFWSKYCDVQSLDIDTESTLRDWNAARLRVSEFLQAKQSAPLERLELDEFTIDSLHSYNARVNDIKVINKTLVSYNNDINHIKKIAEVADTETIVSRLAKLKATKARHSDEISPLCTAYLKEKKAKDCTEAKRDEATKALEEYRVNVFPELQDVVNSYLARFNAGYRIDRLLPSNIGGGSGSTCTYNLIVNDIQDSPIAVRTANVAEGEHSFRNSMSAGDRNTLALALFFSSLDQKPELENTIVVIDDPMSSLDDHRSVTTAQEVGKLVTRAGQVIVMSHNKRFLCSIWDEVKSEERVAIEIAQNGNASTIRPWDVTQEAFTRHDQRFTLLKDYADKGNKPSIEVAQAIRFHLEGFLRVACPSALPPGKLLGQFINDCRQLVGQKDEVLDGDMIQELQEILNYANRFHHDTNPAWYSEEINVTQLKGFVRRALIFAGPPKA